MLDSLSPAEIVVLNLVLGGIVTPLVIFAVGRLWPSKQDKGTYAESLQRIADKNSLDLEAALERIEHLEKKMSQKDGPFRVTNEIITGVNPAVLSTTIELIQTDPDSTRVLRRTPTPRKKKKDNGS